MSDSHDPNMYSYMAEHIRNNECYVCSGTGEGRVETDRDDYEKIPCGKCLGTGKATIKDKARLIVHDQGICLICKMPHVAGCESKPESKYGPSGKNDCLDHLRQYVMGLEKRIESMETKKKRIWVNPFAR